MKVGVLIGGLVALLALIAPASAQAPEPALKPFQPFRVAQFSRYLADGTEALDEPIFRDGGRLNFHQRFPDSHFDRPPNDGLNIGRIFSSPSGVTYGVEVQSPGNSLFAGSDPLHEVGNKAELTQFQNFRKDADDATLHFTVTSAEVEAIDENQAGSEFPGRDECPAQDLLNCLGTMEGEVALTVSAYLTDVPVEQQRLFYHASGNVMLSGFQGNFSGQVSSDAASTAPFWNFDDFEFEPNGDPNEFPFSFAYMALVGPRRYEVDISSVEVGEEFTLEVNTFARTYDRRMANGDTRFGSTVFSYLRDPLEVGGGQLQTMGLTRVAGPLTERPLPPLVTPVDCAGGADPAAGTLQFSTAASAVGEWAGARPPVFVTRTGGSTGDVSATVATTGGSAIAGSDYTALSTTVRFPDGDNTARAIPLEILQDAISEDDKTVNLVLADPSCTTLGAPATTVLSIVDDEPKPRFTIGGTVTGLEGSGLVLENFFEEITPGNGPFEFARTVLEGTSYDVTVAAQPSAPAQTCTVTNGSGTVAEDDITDIGIVCVTPPPDGDLDPSFGDGGKVTTPGMEGGQALVVQPDGKIVVASDNALARYDVDGTLDDTFGDAGIVRTALDADTCFVDGASDLALQPDGSIVAVGIVDDGGATDQNFGLQRYDGNGNLDTGFGDLGTVTTDFGGDRDCPYGVTLQPDGKIVVAGEATGGDIGLARYDSAGLPDTSFGTDATGLVTADIAGELDLATDVTVDAAGNVVVVARVSEDSSLGGFSVVRYTPAGTLDPSFGGGDGITNVDPGSPEGVAIDADGRIVVAGAAQSGFSTGKSDFAVWRLLVNGDRDLTFDGDGLVTTDFADVVGPASHDELAHDLALQADGKIVVVGFAGLDIGGDLALARYGTDGSLDPTFSGDGRLTVDFHGGFDSGQDVALQTDGKIVATGNATNVFSFQLGLVRVNP